MPNYVSQLDGLFTALGDPTRRAILVRLARGPANVSELAEPYDMALPSFLGHLRKLEGAGFIRSTKKGRVRTCLLAPDAFTPIEDWLSEQRAIWEARLDRFDDYAMQLNQERDDGS